MGSRRGFIKDDRPPAVEGTPDRLEIHWALADELRAAARQASASLGRRVTSREYALAVLRHAIDQARIGCQVPLHYSRE